MATISIVGYEQIGHCEHCGRPLKHCIVADDGKIYGAICFDTAITKPKTYNGKKYRVGKDNIIRFAKAAEIGLLKRYGIEPISLIFEREEI